MGNAVHFIDHGPDSGPVIMRSIYPSALYKDYDDVLDQQVPMTVQIMHWLKEQRILVQDGKVRVLKSRYQGSDFVPALESEL